RSPAHEDRSGMVSLVGDRDARDVAIEIDALGASAQAEKVAANENVGTKRVVQFAPGDGAAERGGDVCVDSDLQRPPARLVDRKTLRKALGQQRGGAVISLAAGDAHWPLRLLRTRCGVMQVG